MIARAAITSALLLNARYGPIGVSVGALRTTSGVACASCAMRSMASMNSSSVSLLSVSVGSIINAPLTTNGK